MTWMRLRALLAKELLDLSRNRAAMFPVVISTAVFTVLPFIVTVLIPIVSGHPLGDDKDLEKVSLLAGIGGDLTTNARVQLFLYQQFLLVFLLMPITGAMSLAAHAVVGEKQARTLEPLLATPVTTAELLIAKVLGALLPTLAISTAGMAIYLALVGLTADPGVGHAMFGGRTFLLMFLVGPMAALVSLQAAIIVSSRVNDARTAQQFGVLIIVPLTVLLVGQFTGVLRLSAAAVAFLGLGLFGIWVLLVLFSVALFDREAILTRWR